MYQDNPNVRKSVLKRRARGFLSWLLSIILAVEVFTPLEITVSAEFAGSYPIIYDIPHGTNDAGNPATYNQGVGVAVLYDAVPDEGYVFDGWYANAQYTGNKMTGIASTSTDTVNLYAKFKPANYNVNYFLNGGGWEAEYIVPTSYTYGTGLTLPTADNVRKAGYNFKGWYPTNDCVEDDKVTTIPADATGDKDFYAGWTEKGNLNPTIDINNWFYGENPGILYFGGQYTNPVVTYVGRGTTVYDESETVPTNAGTYTVKLRVPESADYKEGTAQRDFEILRAPIAVKANDNTITYGQSGAANGFVYGKKSGTEFVYGNFTPDTTQISGTVTYKFLDAAQDEYAAGDLAGEYKIRPSGLTSDNYDIIFVDGKLTVGPKPLTVTWSDTSVPYTYDKTAHHPSASISEDQFVDEEHYTWLRADEMSVAVAGTKVTEGFAINAGDYTATASLSFTGDGADLEDCYTLTNDTVDFSIVPKILTISWDKSSFDYDGNDHAPTPTVEGTYDGDDYVTAVVLTSKEGSALTEGKAVNVGSYSAEVVISFVKEINDDNYTAVNNERNHDFTIGAADIDPAVTMDDWVYGSPNDPALTNGSNPGNGAVTYYYKVKGAADSTYSQTKPSNVGEYTVKAVIAAKSIYKAGEATCNFKITPKEIGLTWGTTSFVYKKTNQCPTATATGLIGNDTCTVTVEGGKTDAGSYTATATALSNANYKLPDDDVTTEFDIDKAPQEPPAVTAVNASAEGKNDGKITNVDDTMEYRADGENDYTAIGAGKTSVEGLAPGKYYVRYKGDDNCYVSDDTEIVVGVGDNPAAENDTNNVPQIPPQYLIPCPVSVPVPVTEPKPGPSTEPANEPGPATEPVTEPEPATEPANEPGPATEPANEPGPATEPANEPGPPKEPGIIDQINNTPPNVPVRIQLPENAMLHSEVLKAIKGKNKTIEVELDNGLVWTINGLSVTDTDPIDLNVTIGGGGIPVEVINKVTGERIYNTISLSHDGPFCFDAILTIDLKASNAGYYANLYRFEPSNMSLDYIRSSIIDEEGKAHLNFNHASDYAIIIDEMPYNGLDEDKNPNTNSDVSARLMIILISAGAALVLGSLKKKKADRPE